ncbi:MAG: prepilin-type N-terminal cleavage/methylation domain-containing protein, partial [Gammaproteobacteria bacterium]|nr:prepilin-type N-terminal cleavage/methylation domain-containing protein [Gammaproteobacteria bacterium]
MNDQQLYNNYYGQRGLSLVELMVALALGLFLISGVVHLFAGSKSTNNMLLG